MNAFLDLAEAQTPNPVKAKARAVETRRARAAQAERELANEAVLCKLYRTWKHEQIERLENGTHGRDVRALRAFLRTMTLSSAPALLTLMERARWAREMPVEDRRTLLKLIGIAITRLREREGLPPFDDGLPDEPPKAFEQIKHTLEVT